MIWIVLLIFVVPVFLFFRGMGRANGWIYDFLQEFFNESLQGHRHQRSFARLFALLGSIVVVVAIIALILMLTWVYESYDGWYIIAMYVQILAIFPIFREKKSPGGNRAHEKIILKGQALSKLNRPTFAISIARKNTPTMITRIVILNNFRRTICMILVYI